VWLNVSDVDRTRVSASDQPLEILAGHLKVKLRAAHELKIKFII